MAINAGATAAIGGFSVATDAPIAAGNGNNVGTTLGLNPATSLSTNAGAALGAGLGGSNVGAQAPVTVPVNVGAVVPVQPNTTGAIGLGGNNQTSEANSNNGATQGGTTTGDVTQTQTGGDADVDVTN
ncbi:hypothetical protein ABQF34_30320, partial [Mycolicibacterium boenickei]